MYSCQRQYQEKAAEIKRQRNKIGAGLSSFMKPTDQEGRILALMCLNFFALGVKEAGLS